MKKDTSLGRLLILKSCVRGLICQYKRLAFARRYNEDRNMFSCKVYTTLEDLDFTVNSVFWHDDVLGTVYCQDKDTKEPVWIVSWGDEDGSWWEVNRVPEFYKNQLNTKK